MKYMLGILYAAMLVMTAVTVWLRPSDDNHKLVWATDANPVRTEQMELFRKLHPEYDIMIDPDNATKQKVMIQTLAGVGPDMFDLPGYELVEFADAGIAMDLDPIVALGKISNPRPADLASSEYYQFLRVRYLSEWKRNHTDHEPSTADVAECEQQALLHAVRVARAMDPNLLWPIARHESAARGRMYAYPCNIWSLMVAYHRDLFDQSGVPHPKPDWTWDEFLDTARKLTLRDPKTGRITQYGLLEFYSGLNAAYMQGAEFFNETGTRCIIDCPQAVKAYRFLYDLREKHHVMPTSSEQANMASQGGWGAGGINLFATKKGAMIVFARWGRINWRLINDQARRRGQPIPLHIDFAPQPRAARIYYFGGSRVCAINAKSPRRFEALDFLAYLAGPEYGRQINWCADGIPAPRAWTQTPEQVTSPDYPEDAATDMYWRDQPPSLFPFPNSPFIPFATRNQLVQYHEERMGARMCSVEQGLKDLQNEVNREIEKYVHENPHLRDAYNRARSEQTAIDARRTRKEHP